MSTIMDFDIQNAGSIKLTLHTNSAQLKVCVGSNYQIF